MTPFYLISNPPAWWEHLRRLDQALDLRDADAASQALADAFGALAAAGHADLAAAGAELLLYTSTPFSRAAMRHAAASREAAGHSAAGHSATIRSAAIQSSASQSTTTDAVPDGLARAMDADLATLLGAVRRDWASDVQEVTGRTVPALRELAARPTGAEQVLADALGHEEVRALHARIEEHYRHHGDGELGRFLAFRWSGGRMEGIGHPSMPRMERLVGLSRQLEQLGRNTDAFLAGRPAHHTLLYGPRGSGKSTAVRGLLQKHRDHGLRLVEIAPDDLDELPDVLEVLRGRPHRYVLFVDDLSFERGDTAYRPLKTLLEGSLTEPPVNALLYATSNRRHLVREGFGDRPDPLDDDVHAWDTQHERLALSDRFGLAITFPDAGQRRYLEIVHGLLEDTELATPDATPDLDERAIRFAEWGNGYSGRTAEQFVRTLRSSAEP